MAWVLILPLLIGAAAIGVWLWQPRRRSVVGSEPHCAACGYIVYGLPAPVCPECGADLTVAGSIITSKTRRRSILERQIGWAIFCGLAVYFPAAMLWESQVRPRLPQMRDINRVITLAQPRSNAYRSITVRVGTHAVVSPTAPDPPPTDLRIELTCPDGANRVLNVDASTLSFRETSASGDFVGTQLNTDALVRWLHKFGVSGGDDRIRTEMDIVTSEVNRLRSASPNAGVTVWAGSPFSSYGSSSSASSSNPLPYIDWVPPGCCAIVWIIGAIWIVRRA